MKNIVASCIRIDDQGYGVILDQNRPYRVPNLLPGEVAKISIYSSGFGEVSELVSSSPLRIKPKCRYFVACGGCQLQHMDYQEQLSFKGQKIKNLLKQHGFPQEVYYEPIGMKDPDHYRNKAQMVITEKNRKVMAGFYKEQTHTVVNIDTCLIQNEAANQMIMTARKIMQEQRIPPYDEDKKIGLIRHFLIRTSRLTQTALMVIVTSSEVFPGRNNFVKAIRQAHPEIETIIQNVNPRQTSIVLGDFERVLYGKGHIMDELLGLKFKISSKTFYQINHRQTENLYKKALEFAKPKPSDTVLDLYAGIGTIGLIFASRVKEVIGIDNNRQSVKNAIENARLNQVRHAKFYCAEAKDYLEALVSEKKRVDIVVVDPPRDGLDPNTIQSILALKPTKIVYISCNPETLFRDLVMIKAEGYDIQHCQPVDMFPQTYHVETIAMLSLKTA
ncbi:MAG: 23S rRNA (uracil(1939)-C(5))-methyltransferase RlmD [Candidatus Izemoplasmatales bacterium]|nr:23S rRNA (uracil(1939)-C(5))-methyltransferase RlmD [Candidatus Izemoplasmatales bacterium]